MQLHDWTLVQYYILLLTLGYLEFDSLKTVALNYGVFFLLALTIRKNKKEIITSLAEGFSPLILTILSHPFIAYAINITEQMKDISSRKRSTKEATVVKGKWLKVEFIQKEEEVTLLIPYKRTIIRQQKVEIIKDGETVEEWRNPCGVQLELTAEDYKCDEIRTTTLYD